MGTVFSILLIIGAVWWFILAFRMLPGSTYTTSEVLPGTMLQNRWPHSLLSLGLAIGFLIGGLALLF